MTTSKTSQEADKDVSQSPIPAVSLPKGGGAIQGIGEKFTVNAITGTSSFSVPVYVSPGRNGFTPQLALTYNSGAGNGAFGYGWDVGVPSIKRKTSKGIPVYDDEKDVFLFAGAEDLVPYLKEEDGKWKPVTRVEKNFIVDGYRPRIEGLFAVIEKWTDKATGVVHWKTISKNGVTSLYGLTAAARVSDPNDPLRIFKWILEKTYDPKGNYICYKYKKENSEGLNLSLSYEGPRAKDQKAFNHLYLKSINYGNKTAGLEDDFHFQIVLDYGEHSLEAPNLAEEMPWGVRLDPFSTFTSGFEIRQYRLCRRILMFHDFPELGEKPTLVRATSFQYEESEKASLLTAVTQTGFKSKKGGGLVEKSFPPIQFTYSTAKIGNKKQDISPEQLKDLPYGVDGNKYQWLDLEGEGLPGIFTETADGWFYKYNRGEAGFSAPRLIAEKPYPSKSESSQPIFQDLDADGTLESVLQESTIKGYFDKEDVGWNGFTSFESNAVLPANKSEIKYIDLNGDGQPDILISEDEVFTWYPSKGKKGFGPAEYVRKALEEEKGPAIVFSDPTQSIYLADMSGDGLNDIVRIRNGEVVYWPNMGYGKFGARILMENAPVFNTDDNFSQKRIRLFDVDGSGTTDIIYSDENQVSIWYNNSGNSWSSPETVTSYPEVDNLSSLSVVDILGKGTGALVWSTLLPSEAGRQVKFIDLMSDGKPFLLKSINNNMGKETLLDYTSSTEFYLEDLHKGTTWVTKLSFPVHVLTGTTTLDHISSTRLVTSYKYHHGYYDAEEREFRGFGMVEQTDSESFDTYNADNTLDMPPVYTKSWFHTGAYVKNSILALQFAKEYFKGDTLALTFPDNVIEGEEKMDYAHLREAYRALKGKVLRQEIYAKDGSEKEGIPFSTSQNNYRVRQLQPRSEEKYAVFLALNSESISYSYDRVQEDPRIGHSFLLESDEYGHPLKSIQISYPRRSAAGTYDEQRQLNAVAEINRYFNHTEDFYLLGVPLEQKKFEVHGLTISPDATFSFGDLTAQLGGVFEESNVLLQHQQFTTGVEARLLSWGRNYFCDNENTPLPFGEVSVLQLPHHSEAIVMSNEWVPTVYGERVTDSMLEEAGFINKEHHWWNPGTTIYYRPATSFHLPIKSTDAFGNSGEVQYDAYSLAPIKSVDALGNTISAQIDYRTLSPVKVIDANENTSEVLTDPLGLVVATSVYGTVNGVSKGDTSLSNYIEKENSDIDEILSNSVAFLQGATTFYYYDLQAWLQYQEAPYFITLSREIHVSEEAGTQSPIQISLGYSDGFGRELQSKVKVDDDKNGNEKWLVSGRVVYNNKQKPVKQYEPFYTNTYEYQDEGEVAPVGVTPILYYDALGRLYRTETPKGFHSKVEFNSWEIRTYDENDTVKDSVFYLESIGKPGDESDALKKAEVHYNTPTVVILDSLARQFMGLQYKEDGGVPLVTYTTFDIQGNPLTITDPRQYELNKARAAEAQVQNFRYLYDLSGNNIYTNSEDAGEAWVLPDVFGKSAHVWNSRGYHITTLFDALRRPIENSVEGNGLNQVVQLMQYGESEPDAADKNLKGQLVRQYDQAGLLETLLFNIEGKPLKSTRTLRKEYKTEVNWNNLFLVEMEGESFTTEMEYDAFGRATSVHQPDGSIVKPKFHHVGWLDRVEVLRKNENTYTPFVDSIEYDAKGQRTKIVYGNGVQTTYEYEQETFRLTTLSTTRREIDGTLTILQDIHYVYDPVGNIVKITDYSHEKVFTANQVVNPVSEFVYDALYQLKEATGREHLALSKTDHQKKSDLYKNIHFANINDAGQLRNYTEHYNYDESGNLVQIKHIGHNSFTRDILVSESSNRAITDDMVRAKDVESYFDAAGNMQQLEHLEGIKWNYRNNIASITIVERESENDSEYYVYDGAGQRVRKVKETYNSTGSLLWKEEKIYIGGVEIKRKYQGITESLYEDRSSLHVMDDQKRIAIVYYWNTSSDSVVTAQENKLHYQLGNHLNSASMELSYDGRLISYEEYFPFGGTAFTTGTNAVEVALKEYRYTGKERDDTSGLYYYGARYYASWLGRWLSCDPAGTVDGLNLYRYVRNNPVKLVDKNGNYGEAGHFYTTYFISLAAGFSPDVAFKNAYYSQLPDQILEFDATTVQKEKILNSKGLLGDRTFNKENSQSTQQHVTYVQEGLHALTGKSAAEEQRFRKEVLENQKPGTLGMGLAIHAFEDSYSHIMLKDPTKMYDVNWGHAPEVIAHLPSKIWDIITAPGFEKTWEEFEEPGHYPDEIEKRPELYVIMGVDLYSSLAKMSGATPLLSKEDLKLKLEEVSALPTEQQQADKLKELALALLPPGLELPLYSPENETAVPYAQFNPPPSLYSVEPDRELTEENINVFAREWTRGNKEFTGPNKRNR